MIRQLMEQISEDRIRRRLFALSKEPLLYRKANYTVPGHAKCTLDEADDWIEGELGEMGYAVRREACRVQAYACDRTQRLHHWYARPAEDAPFYTVQNLYASLEGSMGDGEVILLCAHKDSQSWMDSPGANDNAIGTAVTMELAEALRGYRPRHAIRFLFCNEEHRPWMSVVAAAGYLERGQKLLGMFNNDGPGGKSDEDRLAGRMTNVTLYTTPEGKALAELMGEVNEKYGLGLIQSLFQRPGPSDDDGSFIRAGFPAAIVNIGSYPYADPQYHLEGDVPERTDVRNAALTAKAILGAVVAVDQR